MQYYAAMDVSVEASSLCVVDKQGKIFREAKVASEPEALVEWFRGLGVELEVIGFEAGPLSHWLHAALTQAGFKAALLETRHVRTAFKTMPVKTDRSDARGMAQLMRLGWFRPVHCKSLSAQETRALLTARRQLAGRQRDLELSLRGLLRNFGLKVGKVASGSYQARILELVDGHPLLQQIATPMLAARAVLRAQAAVLDRRARTVARADAGVRLLMTAPGVGAIVALDFASAIDEPKRFASSQRVGAYFGLTERRYQSGEKDIRGGISRVGDTQVRSSLYEAAHVILTRSSASSGLKDWALAVAARRGLAKAKVALARKLAVVLHHMLVTNQPFDPDVGRQPAAAAAA